MSKPITAHLDETLLRLQSTWREEKYDRNRQDELYATEFAPAFIPLLRELPLHGAPTDRPRPTALISVLGLSWQPVALMAAWMRPTHMLVLGTQESFRKAPGASEAPIDRIRRLSGVEPIEWHVVSEPAELEIYGHVREFLRKHRLDGHSVAVDPTGGKKSMSAAAALAGFLSGALLVYMDHADYVNRIPMAGTEYPRLLADPLEVFSDVHVERVEPGARKTLPL